jgi:hypothetical protein
VGPEVGSAVGSSVGSAVGIHVGSTVGSAVGSNTGSGVESTCGFEGNTGRYISCGQDKILNKMETFKRKTTILLILIIISPFRKIKTGSMTLINNVQLHALAGLYE